jgi:uncharacterized protein (DUF433 family)
MHGFERITHDPRIMGGKPCIRGMRVTVGMVVGMLAAGHSAEELLRLYPYLEAGDIPAALQYAAWRAMEPKNRGGQQDQTMRTECDYDEPDTGEVYPRTASGGCETTPLVIAAIQIKISPECPPR